MAKKNFEGTAQADYINDVVGKMPLNAKEYEEERQKKITEGTPKQYKIGYEWKPAKRKALIQVYAPEDVRDCIRKYAEEEGTSVNDLLNTLLVAYINLRGGYED